MPNYPSNFPLRDIPTPFRYTLGETPISVLESHDLLRIDNQSDLNNNHKKTAIKATHNNNNHNNNNILKKGRNVEDSNISSGLGNTFEEQLPKVACNKLTNDKNEDENVLNSNSINRTTTTVLNNNNSQKILLSFDSGKDSNNDAKNIIYINAKKRKVSSKNNDNTDEDHTQNVLDAKREIKKIKLANIASDNDTNDNDTSDAATPNIHEFSPDALIDDALPLSPIASSGLNTPNEKMITKFDSNRFNIQDLTPFQLQNLAYKLISNLNRSQLMDLNVVIRDNLKRDFIDSLPLEISIKILSQLSFLDIVHCQLVSSSWNKIIQNTPYIWKQLLITESFVIRDEFKDYKRKLLERYPLYKNVEDIYKFDFLRHCHIMKNWYNRKFIPQRVTLRGHMTSVVTCLQFEDDYIITGADDKMIRIYDSINKKFLRELSGHEGGVWALKYDKFGIVVSGSTDRTVRIWDIKRGRCAYVFKGHTSTVRCLDIVEYKGIRYIVTGSRDNTLHVWKIDERLYDDEPDNIQNWPIVFDTPDRNPYFMGVLRGHLASVRTVSGYGNIVISGSYDNTLIVWDVIKMKCLYILTGHTDRIYSTIYDHKRNRCISASMDSTIRIWDLTDIWRNGPCQIVSCSGVTCTRVTDSLQTLTGHTALVGLLKLSDKFLVSAAADGSLKGWDSDDYSRKFAYHHNNLSAITTFATNDNLLVSGSEGQFHIYNLRTGELVHSELLHDAEQIWSVSFKDNILIVAIEKNSQSYVEILDFNVFEPVPTIRI